MTPSGTLFFNRMTPKVAFCHDLLLPKCRREGRIGGMETKVITFRCPEELLNDINAAAKSIKRSRSTVLVAALRLFSRQLQENNGFPPAGLELMPEKENKGGRPRKKRD